MPLSHSFVSRCPLLPVSYPLPIARASSTSLTRFRPARLSNLTKPGEARCRPRRGFALRGPCWPRCQRACARRSSGALVGLITARPHAMRGRARKKLLFGPIARAGPCRVERNSRRLPLDRFGRPGAATAGQQLSRVREQRQSTEQSSRARAQSSQRSELSPASAYTHPHTRAPAIAYNPARRRTFSFALSSLFFFFPSTASCLTESPSTILPRP